MKFYLGTHNAAWLGRLDVPMFVSRRRLEARRTLPVAVAPWVLDSGGFTEVTMRGGWTLEPACYADTVHRLAAAIGSLAWAAPQDWMCEPAALRATGLTIAEHQHRTTTNYLELRAIGGPFVPVLQGWTVGHYLEHVAIYQRAGVDLAALPVVGLGSVCRRQASREIEGIVVELAAAGLRLHGFGMKAGGLARVGHLLASADSMAWSHAGRLEPRCSPTRRNCANCQHYALTWRERILTPGPAQLHLIA